MKNLKKALRASIIIVACLLVLSPTVWFIGTRFCTDRYTISSNLETITFKKDTYIREGSSYGSERELQAALDYQEKHIGKTIGVAVFPKRSLADLIWPYWVMEYDGDTAHNRIFVRGLMDIGSVYIKVRQ